MVTTKGVLSGGTIVRGATGIDLTYNAVGARAQMITGTGFGQRQESYTYFADGGIDQVSIAEGYGASVLRADTSRDLLGRVDGYVEYNGYGGVTHERYAIGYDLRGQVLTEKTRTLNGSDWIYAHTVNDYSATGASRATPLVMEGIDKYLADVRPDLACGADDGTLFLSTYGQALGVERVAEIVREAVNDAGIGKRGSCHMFRHTMATLMLENGADIRFIQAMLGHADLKTTELYTQVSIKALKAVHTATHPARPGIARHTSRHGGGFARIIISAAALPCAQNRVRG